MRKITTIAMALMMGMMMLVSCNKDKDNDGKVVFHASIESRNQDRTYLEPDGNQGYVKWMAGDQIRIYNGNGENAVFTLKSGANTTDGTFTYAGEFEMVPPFTAVYPTTAEITDDGLVVFEVPVEQNLTQPNTFANGANPMVATGTDDNLNFRNLCGGIGIRLKGAGVHVTTIYVSGAGIGDNQGIYGKLNGQFAAPIDGSTNNGLAMWPTNDEGNAEVIINCDVTLTSEISSFYAVLPVGALSDWVDIAIYDGDNYLSSFGCGECSDGLVERNKIKSYATRELVTYVDLDLPSGLLWATRNLGANAPEEYGDYFAWGEIEPKDVYSQSTYLFWNGTWDDCYDGYGYTTLSSYHDAATVNWDSWNWSNNLWRMPTAADWEELLENTTSTWTQQNGVNGQLFTAANGNSIFLPAAGYRDGSGLYLAGSYGFYWSSSLNTDNPLGAWSLYFGSDYCLMDSYSRLYGRSVRPVRSASQN